MRKPFIAEDYGDFISVAKENVVLKNKDKVESTPLKEISHIIIRGQFISFSSAFVFKCLKRNIPIILTDGLWKPYSVISSIRTRGYVSELQIKFSNSWRSTGFVCQLLKEKIRKQHQVLHYHIRSLRLNKKNEIKSIEDYDFRNFFKTLPGIFFSGQAKKKCRRFNK